jgi:eukaryotic-like serine/threonine-protein kinase
MALLGRQVLRVAVLTAFTIALRESVASASPIQSPLYQVFSRVFHNSTYSWSQFRLGPGNNAVLPGRLTVSWQLETGGQISSSPTIYAGTLFIGNNIGKLYAIDVATGSIRWTYHVANSLMSAPLIYQNLVIVGEGDATSMGTTPSEPGVVGMGPSALLALDRKTGELRWRVDLAGSAMPTPAIIGNTLYHHNGAGWITALNPLTGHQEFATRLSSVASMSAILPVGNAQFITDGVGTNAVWRMDARTGATVWRSLFPSGVSGIGDCPPVTDGKRILCDYVAPLPPDQVTIVGHRVVERVYGIDADTGIHLWNVALERGTLPERNEAAIPLFAGGVLYVGSAIAPVMHALDPVADGKLIWKTWVRGPIKSGSVLVDGTLYFGDLEGYLWALDAKSGRVIGSKYMHTQFNVGSPIVDGQTLIMGSNTGRVIAIPLVDIRNSHEH